MMREYEENSRKGSVMKVVGNEVCESALFISGVRRETWKGVVVTSEVSNGTVLMREVKKMVW